MVIFSPDGQYAYICSSFTPQTVVVSTASRRIVARIQQASVFCPNIAASPDGRQVWFTLKDSGRVQVIDARPPFHTITVIKTGPITNHMNFAVTARGQFAYVSVGGLSHVKVFTTNNTPKLIATVPTGDNPHGLWPSGDGKRIYVGLQSGNAVAAIDTLSNQVIANIAIGGQGPMGMVYIPGAVPTGNGTTNLSPQDAEATSALHIKLISASSKTVQSAVVINKQGLIDQLEAGVTGLQPGKTYVIALANSPTGGGALEPVCSFTALSDGSASTTSIGLFRNVLSGGSSVRRYLVVAPFNSDKVGAAIQLQQA
eukprot:jgi/Chrzof1/3118/Cz12g12190.t1